MLEKELSLLTAKQAAARLIGCDLIRIIDGVELKARIVETEAYDETDHASHTYRGRTKRNEVMFGLAGRSYVYFTYGMHYCVNIVVGKNGNGSGVLVRAMEPLEGIEFMLLNRQIKDSYDLLNGPAKICQAFKINLDLNGHDLSKPPLLLSLNQPIDNRYIAWTERIGIKQGKEKEKILLWRACLSGSRFLSRPL